MYHIWAHIINKQIKSDPFKIDTISQSHLQDTAHFNMAQHDLEFILSFRFLKNISSENVPSIFSYFIFYSYLPPNGMTTTLCLQARSTILTTSAWQAVKIVGIPII